MNGFQNTQRFMTGQPNDLIGWVHYFACRNGLTGVDSTPGANKFLSLGHREGFTYGMVTGIPGWK